MKQVLSNKSVVNNLLYNQRYTAVDCLINSKEAYLIHTSVLSDILNCLFMEFGIIDVLHDLKLYTLNVGEASFNMALVFVKCMKVISVMDRFVKSGQYTKRWECYLHQKSTLFIDLHRYHILEKFIKMHNLEKSIISTVVELGINTNQNHIKIVTFSQEVNYISLVYMFENFLTSELLETDNNRHYYINYAFDWHQPVRLSQINKPVVNERLFIGLHTFLDCLQEDSLNILELCSMKLAFCELSFEFSFSAMLAARIDGLITTLLEKAECDGYIQNGEFNLHGYAKKHKLNLINNAISCDYFLYTFQNYFQSIKLDSSIFDNNSEFKTITLINPQDLLLELRGNSNIIFTINAYDFPGMDAKLLSSILQCGNVQLLILNTKAQWFHSNDPLVSDARVIFSKTMIFLLNPDQLFMVTFIKSLNSMANTEYLILHLAQPNLQSFSIFKNLNVSVTNFADITLTSTILEELMEGNFYRKVSIGFLNAKIVNDVYTWLLFIRFNFSKAEIIEEENTWQNLFDAIVLQTDSDFYEFEINNTCIMKAYSDKLIDLTAFKFSINESKTKLEIKDKFSNRQIDLFDLKNELDFSPEEEDGSQYEFYQ